MTQISTNAKNQTPSVQPIDSEEVYQLIKRSDINPREVEDRSQQAIEVTVLWNTSILHVAHLRSGDQFTFNPAHPKFEKGALDPKIPSAVGASAVAATALLRVGMHAAGSISAVAAGAMLLGGAAACAGMYQVESRRRRNLRFVVGAEFTGKSAELPVVYQGSDGKSRFVFLPSAQGTLEIDNSKRTLADLIASGDAVASSRINGAHEVVILPECRYRMDINGFTVQAKAVASARKVAGAKKRDRNLISTFAGVSVACAALALGMKLSSDDMSGALSAPSIDDQLTDLAAIVQRVSDTQTPQEQTHEAAAADTGADQGQRHAGENGTAGTTHAQNTHNRMAVRDNHLPPHMSREQARNVVEHQGVILALNMVGANPPGAQGPTDPFSSMNTESGRDDRSARGNYSNGSIGEAFGFNGLGDAGWGPGGGGTNPNFVGVGNSGENGRGWGHHGVGWTPTQGHLDVNVATPGPRLRVEQPEPTPGLDPNIIRRVVQRNIGQVRHCQEQGLQTNPNLEGRVVVNFQIGPDGRVIASAPGASNGNVPPSVSQCIALAARRWTFPAPDSVGAVNVRYPFTLQRAVGGN